MTPETWGILGSLLLSLGTLGKMLLDQRGTKLKAQQERATKQQDATLADAGQRREEWYTEAQKLQTRIDTMDTAYKTRIDAMDTNHKAELRELQTQNAKAREDHYDMVKLQLNMTVQLNLCEQQVRDLQAIIRRLDEHIVDLYVSIQQEPEAGPRILSRLRTARPAVLLRDLNITKGDPNGD